MNTSNPVNSKNNAVIYKNTSFMNLQNYFNLECGCCGQTTDSLLKLSTGLTLCGQCEIKVFIGE